MSTTTDRVALIIDCLGHRETKLSGQPRLWRHRDGRYVSDDEAALIAEATRSDIRQALNLRRAELEDTREVAELGAEFHAILRTINHEPGDTIRSITYQLAPADAERARQIWQRIGPQVMAWLTHHNYPRAMAWLADQRRPQGTSTTELRDRGEP